MLVILHAERNGMHQRISGDQGVHHGREGTCPWMRRGVLQLTDALSVTPHAAGWTSCAGPARRQMHELRDGLPAALDARAVVVCSVLELIKMGTAGKA